MKKITPYTWLHWLINYITEPIRKVAGGFKDKVVSFFNANTPKQNVYRRKKKLSKPKTQNKIKKNEQKKQKKNIDRIKGIIKNIWTLYETENENKERKKIEKKNNWMTE